MSSEPEQVTLSENMVLEVAGLRVGLSNVWEETFDDARGRSRTALRGTVSVMSDDAAEDHDRRVSEGDEVIVGRARYRVVGVTEGNGRGSMTLRRVPPPWRSLGSALLTFLTVLPFLGLPYLAEGGARAGLAVAAIPAWVVLTRPTWFGVAGFFSGLALLVHALVCGVGALLP